MRSRMLESTRCFDQRPEVRRLGTTPLLIKIEKGGLLGRRLGRRSHRMTRGHTPVPVDSDRRSLSTQEKMRSLIMIIITVCGGN